MSTAKLTAALKVKARELGFGLSGVCPAVSPTGITRFREWLAAGYAGEMRYLVDRCDAYTHPSSILDGVRSLLLLGMHYRSQSPQETPSGHGRIARYAWGEVDYHDLIHARLKRLAAWLGQECPQARARGVVDTAPLLEREFAQLAGLGWVGKNTLLLNKDSGSYFFLAALLTDVELSYDDPHETDHCGTCRACLDACPTDAFPQPYVLDATRCLSYLTIELRDQMPLEMREEVGDWLFGCDICQEVCPWNRHAPVSDETGFHPTADQNPIDLSGLFFLSDEQFRARFRKTPLWRPKRRGILRNAAMVLGNQAAPEMLPSLRHGLNDNDPVVRGSCAWALGRLPQAVAGPTLRERRSIEADVVVQEEIARAIART